MQLGLRDETISRLNEEVLFLKKERDSTILTLGEHNEKLMSELQELKDHFSIKREGKWPCSVLHCFELLVFRSNRAQGRCRNHQS